MQVNLLINIFPLWIKTYFLYLHFRLMQYIHTVSVKILRSASAFPYIYLFKTDHDFTIFLLWKWQCTYCTTNVDIKHNADKIRIRLISKSKCLYVLYKSRVKANNLTYYPSPPSKKKNERNSNNFIQYLSNLFLRYIHKFLVSKDIKGSYFYLSTLW